MSMLHSPNGHGPAPAAFTPEELTALIEEAELIVAKRSLKFPTADHLRAVLQARDVMAETAAKLTNIAALQNRALIVSMLTMKTGHMEVNAQAIRAIEAQGLDLSIARAEKGGPIVVRMIRPVPPAQKEQ